MIIAGIIHSFHFDHAKACGIRHRRAAHAGKDDAGEDVDLTQAARPVADHRLGKVENTVRDSARIHQVSRKDKERNRQQRKACGSVINSLGHHRKDPSETECGKDRLTGNAHCNGNGHTDQHQTDQYDADNQCNHSMILLRRPHRCHLPKQQLHEAGICLTVAVATGPLLKVNPVSFPVKWTGHLCIEKGGRPQPSSTLYDRITADGLPQPSSGTSPYPQRCPHTRQHDPMRAAWPLRNPPC